MIGQPYTFRPFAHGDLTIAARWLQTPEVIRWWGDPVEQLALLSGDLAEPLMRQWIVEYQGTPFAYLQAYPALAWPQSHLSHLPQGAQVVDVFVGEPDMLGRDHGSAMLRLFAEKLLAEGAAVVAIDPAADNWRARRAFARAGFTGDIVVVSADGPVVLMLFSGWSAAKGMNA
ncbi:MAG: GNAT family N-acetyltransferase [Lautropia sp.]